MEPAVQLDIAPQPLGPDSLWFRNGLPRTLLLLAGRPLLMQVAHPVIGAGVRDFSAFREDPWGRLERTTSSLEKQIFGGREALEEAERLWKLHRDIKGTGFQGERYSALNPQAYAWTHLTVFDAVRLMWDRLGPEVPQKHHEQVYTEWRQAGLVLGVKDDLMPGNLAELQSHIDDVVTNQLTANTTTEQLIDTLALRDVPPPPGLPAPVWAALKPFGHTVLYDFGVGTLPPELREKLGVRWGRTEQLRLDLMMKAVHTVVPAVPAKLMQYPAGYRATRASLDYRKGLPAT